MMRYAARLPNQVKPAVRPNLKILGRHAQPLHHTIQTTFQMLCRRFTGTAVLGFLLVVLLPIHAAAVETPWPMYEDPVLKRPVVETAFPPGLVDRWLQALARPEREMKRRAALAIADAVARGVSGLDVTVEPLSRVLREPGQDRVVRLTAARALVALDARPAVSALVEATGPKDLDMAEIVEPALARWKETALRERWMERINADNGQRRLRELAIHGLAALGETSSLPRLRELAVDRNAPTAVRFAAADALGAMQSTGLAETARQLAQDRSAAAVVDRLVAVRILAGHSDDETVKLLKAMATDDQPSVGSLALGQLFRIDPSLILPLIDTTVDSNDANIRRRGAETLVARPSSKSVGLLAPMLDDRNPAIRRYVCDSLVTLAKDSALRETVMSQGRQVLNAEGWRGQEQATLLLVTLDDTTIVNRLIELLDASRPEANVVAAWGLCQLAVPETAGPVLAVVQRRIDSWMARQPQNPGLDDQLALLCQMLGILNYSDADRVMREFIPKGFGPGDASRAAAIWTLGHLHANQVDEQLARALEKRLVDAFNIDYPESWLVCRMAAVTLGRMKAENRLPALRKTLEGASLASDLGYASAWAIAQLTGEAIPALTPVIEPDLDWFLIPALNL